MLKQEKGITLVALVITIIVLIILAAVSISLVFGSEGIIARTKQAAKDYQNAENAERQIVTNVETLINDALNDLNP